MQKVVNPSPGSDGGQGPAYFWAGLPDNDSDIHGPKSLGSSGSRSP